MEPWVYWLLIGGSIAFAILFWTAITSSIYKSNKIRAISLLFLVVSAIVYFIADYSQEFLVGFLTVFGVVFFLIGCILMIMSFVRKKELKEQ